VRVSRLLDLDDFLDPKSLTPQQLYKLQSDTWVQGAEYERERIIKLLLNGWIDESSPIIKEIRENNE
jgi:hypothetical protein